MMVETSKPPAHAVDSEQARDATSTALIHLSMENLRPKAAPMACHKPNVNHPE